MPKVVPTQAIHHPNLRRVQETEDLLGEAWKASHSTHDILSRIWTLLSTPQLDMPNIDPQIAAEFTVRVHFLLPRLESTSHARRAQYLRHRQTDPDTYSQKATASARAAGEGVGVERLQRLHAGKADASIERIYEEKATFALADEGVSESPEPLLDDDSDTITLRHVEAALVAGGLLLVGALIGRRIRF